MTRRRKAAGRTEHGEVAPRSGVLRVDLLPEPILVVLACAAIWLLITHAPDLRSTATESEALTELQQAAGGADGPVSDMGLLPNGDLIVAARLGELKRYDSSLAQPGGLVETSEVSQLNRRSIVRLAASRDAGDAALGGAMIGGAMDGSVVYWPRLDSPGPEAVLLGTGHGYVTSVAISRNAEWAATAGVDLTIRLWRLGDRKMVWTAPDGRDPALAIAFSPDSRLLAWASRQGLSLVSVEGDFTANAIPDDSIPEPLMTLTFSPDSRFLVLGHVDGQVSLWNVAARRIQWTVPGNHGTVLDAAFHPNGESVLAGHIDGSLRILDLATGETLGVVRAHRMGVRRLLVSHDGTRLVTGGYDGRIRRWDLATMEALP